MIQIKYTLSMPIFRVILPGIAISSTISVVMHNYYKVLKMNIVFFKKSVVILLFSILANGLAYLWFRSMKSISAASIITIVVWYLYSEQFFVTEYGYNRWRNLIYMLLMLIFFYLVTGISNLVLSGLLYLVGYIVISLVFHRDTLRKCMTFCKT